MWCYFTAAAQFIFGLRGFIKEENLPKRTNRQKLIFWFLLSLFITSGFGNFALIFQSRQENKEIQYLSGERADSIRVSLSKIDSLQKLSNQAQDSITFLLNEISQISQKSFKESSKFNFRPLTTEYKNSFIDNFNKTCHKYLDDYDTVEIVLIEGDRDRELFLRQFRQLIEKVCHGKCVFKISPPYRKGNLSPIKITANDPKKGMQFFALMMYPIMKWDNSAEMPIEQKSTIDKGKISFEFNGRLLFNEDGRVFIE